MTIGDTLNTKETLIGLTLWALAAVGFSANNSQEQQIQRPYSRFVSASQEIRKSEPNATPKPTPIIAETFVFNQRDEKVAELQTFLGVKADGHYGKVTRKAHLAALEAAGMETAFVPAVPSPITDGHKRRYTISDDPTHRCPQFEPLFREHGLEPVEVFSYIAYRESRCNPKAANAKWDSNGNVTWTLNKDGSIDRGLLQINSCWKTVTKSVCGTGLEGLFDVNCNLKVAKYIMDNSSGGLANWNVWNK